MSRVLLIVVLLLTLVAIIDNSNAHGAYDSGPFSLGAGVTECFEDLSCSDGSRLAQFQCERSTYLDHGRIVHSNGRCSDIELGA